MPYFAKFKELLDFWRGFHREKQELDLRSLRNQLAQIEAARKISLKEQQERERAAAFVREPLDQQPLSSLLPAPDEGDNGM